MKNSLPYTLNRSSELVVSTFNARFFSVSLNNLSLKWREVTNFPSLPKKGELMVNAHGWLVSIRPIPSGFSKSAIVSPISKSSKPTTAQISPLLTFSTLVFPKPSKTCSSLMRIFFIASDLQGSNLYLPLNHHALIDNSYTTSKRRVI